MATKQIQRWVQAFFDFFPTKPGSVVRFGYGAEDVYLDQARWRYKAPGISVIQNTFYREDRDDFHNHGGWMLSIVWSGRGEEEMLMRDGSIRIRSLRPGLITLRSPHLFHRVHADKSRPLKTWMVIWCTPAWIEGFSFLEAGVRISAKAYRYQKRILATFKGAYPQAPIN